MTNIVNILTFIPNASVYLRINYKESTLDLVGVIDQINEIIPQKMRSRIVVSPKKNWQEDEKSINQTKLNNFIDKISDSGYKVEAVEYGICYVDYKHCTTIFPNGKVDICNLDNPDGRAILGDDGDVVWYNEDLCFQQSADKENIVCNHCNHFPICCGPCPVQRNNMIRTTGKVSCMFSLEEKEEKWRERLQNTTEK